MLLENRRLHRPQRSAREDRQGSQGLPLVRLRGSDCGQAGCPGGNCRAGSGDVQLEVSANAIQEEPMQFYRAWLIELGAPVLDEAGNVIRTGFEPEEAGGKLTQRTLLSTRVRYFTAGLAIGSRAFCEELFQRYRNKFGPNRQSGARPWRLGEWGELYSLRDLRKNVFGKGG